MAQIVMLFKMKSAQCLDITVTWCWKQSGERGWLGMCGVGMDEAGLKIL